MQPSLHLKEVNRHNGHVKTLLLSPFSSVFRFFLPSYKSLIYFNFTFHWILL